MPVNEIKLELLTPEAFAPFGDIIDAAGSPDMMINEGRCGRFHDLARLDFGDEPSRAGISIFRSEACTLPYVFNLMERHPLGSQAFIPMSADPFLVIVAPDENGIPGRPLAFRTEAGQGINFHRNIWHGVLTPLFAPGLFAVVDRIGNSANLQEYWYETPFTVSGDVT